MIEAPLPLDVLFHTLLFLVYPLTIGPFKAVPWILCLCCTLSLIIPLLHHYYLIYFTGPYIIVYGEDEASSDAPWCVRAESSNQVLHSVLLSVGAQPDSLIPEDTFTFEDPPSSELTPLPLDAGLDDIGPLSPFMQLDIDQGMGMSAGSGSGGGGGGGPFHTASEADSKKGTTDSTRQTTTAGPTSKYSSSDPAQHSSAGALDLTLNLGLADGMTDEQLAEYLSSTFT